MASKCLIIFSLLSIAASAWSAAAQGSGSLQLPCVQKILPCQPYLKSPNPPATCCVPLKEVVANDQKCLCAVFNNADLLRSFNTTQDEAMKLAKACQADVDVSICNSLLEPPSASPTPSSPPAKEPSKPQGNAAHGGIKAVGGGLVVLFLSSVVLSALN